MLMKNMDDEGLLSNETLVIVRVDWTYISRLKYGNRIGP